MSRHHRAIFSALKGEEKLNKLVAIYQSSTGKKFIMALTGLIGIGFVFMHMLGNLQIYLGAAKLNAYAEFLKANPGVLWGARFTLLGAIFLHILMAYQLTVINHRSRPVNYVKWQPQGSDYASRTMRYSAAILLLFIVYHLADFTLGVANPSFEEGNVYGNVIASFQNPLISALYIVAMLCLGLHMYHGVWSMFQTLGANNSKYNNLLRNLAAVFTAVVVAGNISIPVSVLAGIIKN